MGNFYNKMKTTTISRGFGNIISGYYRISLLLLMMVVSVSSGVAGSGLRNRILGIGFTTFEPPNVTSAPVVDVTKAPVVISEGLVDDESSDKSIVKEMKSKSKSVKKKSKSTKKGDSDKPKAKSVKSKSKSIKSVKSESEPEKDDKLKVTKSKKSIDKMMKSEKATKSN